MWTVSQIVCMSLLLGLSVMDIRVRWIPVKREKEGIDETVLNALFRQRISGKCILFSAPDVAIHIGENEIEVTATALRKHMSVSVLEKAAITEPEQYIRDMRKAGKLID